MAGGKPGKHARDVYSRPRSLPLTLYTECRFPERSMQALMGLTGDQKKMKAYVETMSVCASRHLDASKAYSQQPKETMARYVRSVSRHIDVMDAYEDAWPAIAYAKIWLNWSHKARKGRAHRRGAPARSTESAPPKSSKSRSRGASTQKTDRSQSKPENNKENDDVSSGQSLDPEDAHQSSSQTLSTIQSAQATQFTQRPLLSSSSSRTSTLSTASFANPVATFLHNLAQPLDHLLPVFHTAGVRDAGSLHGLARLRNRGDWLYVLVVDRKITPLEYKFIVDGLDDLIEAKQG
ncbi:hypothetical protein C8T65DRAFT_255498 [Cerioporus squamosus]|nr:hypothetical protein C8T65DRAFT_255498 [Cerioporus squamosus]